MLNFDIHSEIFDAVTYKRCLHFVQEWKDSSASINQLTSGSTGQPKLINIEKSKMIKSAQMTGDFFELQNCQNALLCIPVEYIGGKMLMVRSDLYNLKIIPGPINSNPIENLTNTIDFAAMVPYQVQTILKKNPEKLNLIKYLIIGGAPTDSNMEKELQKYSCQSYATFGMTETISHIALKNLALLDSPFQMLGKGNISSKDNQLIINSPELAIDGLLTNDIVEIIDNQTFYWKGRKDNVINSGGIKIYPEEIERLVNLDGFFITKEINQEFGECAIGIYNMELHNELAVKEACSSQLSNFQMPKKFVGATKFFYLKSGKLDKQRILKNLKIG